MAVLRIATRGSPLARWQAERVAGLVRAAEPSVETELVVVATVGDRRQAVPIAEMGGKGVFAKEVQAAVLDGRADLAVHSAKDLPSETPEGLVIAAVPERGDPRDALVGSTLDGLLAGGVVATGSQRRRAQLAAARPGLRVAELRGNMHTRLDKAAGFDAIVVAAVALDRLGLADRISERLGTGVMVPQAGQGCMAVECRSGDAPVRDLLAAVDHHASHRCLDAERAFLAELGGDCTIPAGALATVRAGAVDVDGLLASADGATVLRHRAGGADAAATGRAVARHLLDTGGAELLGR
ncbi:MAG: hydroxymethylbilane synthase [Actinobacteria bacterium]|nr:hydroxymethylbilane synthase [Actinomycetota bacterium]